MILLIILIIIILTIIISKTIITNNSNHIILTKEELIDILLKDNDNYYKKFNSNDLKVRNVSSISEYKKNIKSSPITLNKNDKDILIKNINKADNLLKKYKIIGFDGKKSCKIPWIIGIVNNELYEGGYPHTRNNVIIIPKNLIYNPNLYSTLIHEKVHVYQKVYPHYFNQYLKYNKFKKLNRKNNNYRSNPDINNYDIYVNHLNQEFKCEYNNNPKNIMDVNYSPINLPMYEHPLEYMAYYIQNDISKRNYTK